MESAHTEIKRLLKKEDPVIFEIGAYIGTDTEIFLNDYKDLKIFCFEPDPRCIKLFKRNIKDKRCSLIEAAVSDTDGEIFLNLSSRRVPFTSSLFQVLNSLRHILLNRSTESLGQASIVKSVSSSKDYPWLVFDKTVKVKAIKLSNWTIENKINFVDLIWLDVQGAERKVIEGASEVLRITKYLFTEYGETSPYPEAMSYQQTIDLMEKYNFELIQQHSSSRTVGDLLFKNRAIS